MRRSGPKTVANAFPLADEALRRYEAGELKDDEYYPAGAVRHRILRPTDQEATPPLCANVSLLWCV
jgi:hypothetical protein